MRTILGLFADARGRGHVAVFHEFAKGLARVLRRKQPMVRVRTVGP